MLSSNSPYLCVYNNNSGKGRWLDNVDFGSLCDYPLPFSITSSYEHKIDNLRQCNHNCHNTRDCILIDGECAQCPKEMCIEEEQSPLPSSLSSSLINDQTFSTINIDKICTDKDLMEICGKKSTTVTNSTTTRYGDEGNLYTNSEYSKTTDSSTQNNCKGSCYNTLDKIPESIIREIGIKSSKVSIDSGHFGEDGYIEQCTETNNWYWYMITCRPNYVNINNRSTFEEKLLEISEQVLVEALYKFGIHSLLTTSDCNITDSGTSKDSTDESFVMKDIANNDSCMNRNSQSVVHDHCDKKYNLMLDREKILSKSGSLSLLDEIYQNYNSITTHNATSNCGGSFDGVAGKVRNSKTFKDNKSGSKDRNNKEKKYVLILLVYYHQLLNYDPEQLDDSLSTRLMESIVPFIDRTVLHECTNSVSGQGNGKTGKAINKTTGNRTILELDSNPEITLARYNESIDKYYTIPHDKAQGSPLQYFFQYFLGLSDFNCVNTNTNTTGFAHHETKSGDDISEMITTDVDTSQNTTNKLTQSHDENSYRHNFTSLEHREKYVRKSTSNSNSVPFNNYAKCATISENPPSSSVEFINSNNSIKIDSRVDRNYYRGPITNTSSKKQPITKKHNSKTRLGRINKNRTSSGSIRKRNFSNSGKVSSGDIEKLGRITTPNPTKNIGTSLRESFAFKVKDGQQQQQQQFTTPETTTTTNTIMSNQCQNTNESSLSMNEDISQKGNMDDVNLQTDPTRFRHNLALVVDFGNDLDAAKEFHKAIGTKTRGKTRFSVVMYYLSRMNRPNYTCFFSIFGTQLYFHAIKYNHDLMTLEVLSLNK